VKQMVPCVINTKITLAFTDAKNLDGVINLLATTLSDKNIVHVIYVYKQYYIQHSNGTTCLKITN